MGKRTMVLAAITTFVAACTSSAPTGPAARNFAPSRDVQADADAPATEPGVPGTPNCRGQSEKYLAQGAGGTVDTHGIGGIAAFADLTVKEVKAIVDAFCAGT